MQIKEDIKLLTENLKNHIDRESYANDFHEVYDYSLFPAGKLFRPLLVFSVFKDKKISGKYLQNFLHLCAFVETHHTYTLNHDDMPCMDDDDIRRGRPSVHKKFSPWHALLSGDGLLNASYSMISKIESKNFQNLFKYLTWCLGPKGLILGQALDLSGEMTKSFDSLILTHKLKTARLIQASLVGSLLLTADEKELTFKEVKGLHKLGEKMGVAFQLLDDLCELEDEVLTAHEDEVNPWPKETDKCFKELKNCLEYIDGYFKENDCAYLKEVFSLYLKKIKTLLRESSSTIESHINLSLDPIMMSLDGLSSSN